MRTFITCRVPRTARSGAVAVVFALALSCGQKRSQPPPPPPLTADESYLVESYAGIKRAESMYRTDSMVADSLFVYLDGTVDSLRIARTIEAINQAPDRWVDIFNAIEKRLRDTDDESSN